MRILVDPHIAQTVVGCFEEFGQVVSLYGVPLDIQPYVRGDWLITSSAELANEWFKYNSKSKVICVGTQYVLLYGAIYKVRTFTQAYRLLKGMNECTLDVTEEYGW